MSLLNKSTGTYKGIFIAGTDTGIGKTFVGAAITKALKQRNVSIQPRKPVESGCELVDGKLLANDALQYYLAIDKEIPLSTINGLAFAAALAPPFAADLVGKTVKLSELFEHTTLNIKSHDMLLVEGAGGIMSPLAHDALNIDLMTKLGIPALLVSANRLGCVNHILMSLATLAHHQVPVVAIVLNDVDEASAELSQANTKAISQYSDIPVLPVKHGCVEGSEISEIVDTILTYKQ